jgi:hypothetical protein
MLVNAKIAAQKDFVENMDWFFVRDAMPGFFLEFADGAVIGILFGVFAAFRKPPLGFGVEGIGQD